MILVVSGYTKKKYFTKSGSIWYTCSLGTKGFALKEGVVCVIKFSHSQWSWVRTSLCEQNLLTKLFGWGNLYVLAWEVWR